MAPHPLLHQKAPTDIILKNQHDEDVNLADHIGKSTIVLFYYPKDNTYVCSKEACSFRDNYEEIQKLGAEVFGISGDSVKSHKGFSTKQNLTYNILADTENQFRTTYQVGKLLFGLPQRTTYIIGKDGEVKNVFESMFSANYHVSSVIKALKAEETTGEAATSTDVTDVTATATATDAEPVHVADAAETEEHVEEEEEEQHHA